MFKELKKIVLAIGLLALALVAGTLLNKPFIKQYFPFIPLLLLLFTTWYLYSKDEKNLSELGLNRRFKNWSLLPLGVLVGMLGFFVAKYVRSIYVGEQIEFSESFDYVAMIKAFYFILPTVAVEELLFRGYLFEKTIALTSVTTANILFAILFMLIHVVDSSILANKGLVLLMVISIPIGHLLFATALLKSKTILFPIGIHLGNNWATRHLITNANDANSLLYIPNVVTFNTWTPFILSILLFNAVFLIITYVIWKWK